MRARKRGVERERRRLFDDFLMAALDRALALAEVHDRAVRVGEDLELDVPRPAQVAFEQHGVVAERASASRRAACERVVESRELVDDAHAAAAAAGTRLDDQRRAERPASRAARVVVWSSPS